MGMPRIHLGYDHAAIDVAKVAQRHLHSGGYDVHDHGPARFDPEDDYPEYCLAAAQAVMDDCRAGVEALGIVLGGSGNGEQIAANKVLGVRAALVWSLETARLAREHNDANVMGIGARQHSQGEVLSLIDTFVTTAFSGQRRHRRRIAQIADFEHKRFGGGDDGNRTRVVSLEN